MARLIFSYSASKISPIQGDGKSLKRFPLWFAENQAFLKRKQAENHEFYWIVRSRSEK
ncbi:MAG: hypothetical protein LBD04_11300 [Synergistaceae bacterium]|jgi:hypothetical protein|nr:hypothetical protein [Synergistaceae bacterium]